jgi:outer membrane receptor protein involved in Fe transport
VQGSATYTKARFGNQLLADPTLVDIPGSVAGYAPTWAGSAGVSYQWNFNSKLIGRFNINAKYSGDYLASGLPEIGMTQKAYTLLNARFTVADINKHWSIEFWGENLTNRTYIQAYFNPALQTGSIDAFLAAPRTYGITLHGQL